MTDVAAEGGFLSSHQVAASCRSQLDRQAGGAVSAVGLRAAAMASSLQAGCHWEGVVGITCFSCRKGMEPILTASFGGCRA